MAVAGPNDKTPDMSLVAGAALIGVELVDNKPGADWLHQHIAAGGVGVIDGATGTELQARGVPMAERGWSALAQLSHPDILQEIHEDYIRVGASVIIANTFAAGRALLEPAGYGHLIAEVHGRAVEIAKDARAAVGGQVAIAGSISTWMADANDAYWFDRAEETYLEQVELLVAAGVDLIACEMVQHPERSELGVQAAVSSGLPVWVGLTAKRAHNGTIVNFGYPDVALEVTADPILEMDVDVVSIMHTAVQDVGPALDWLDDRWDGPVGVYPEAGYFTEPEWQFVDQIAPSHLATEARGWLARGVQVIGGCCGLGVAHIEALTDLTGGLA